jgi:hypothetical protein
MSNMVELDEAAWPAQARSARVSVRPLIALLSVVLIALVGAYAGAWLEKRHGAGTTGGTSAASLFGAGGFGGNRTRGTGTGRTAATGSGFTTGTVTEITKKLLYLTSSSGALVKVKLTARTTFTRTAAKPTGGLALGDTATVRGAKDQTGVLVATSVIATAKGVVSTFGGGGGFGGGFGAGAPTAAPGG